MKNQIFPQHYGRTNENEISYFKFRKKNSPPNLKIFNNRTKFGNKHLDERKKHQIRAYTFPYNLFNRSNEENFHES